MSVLYSRTLGCLPFVDHGFGTSAFRDEEFVRNVVVHRQVHGNTVSVWPHLNREGSDALICREVGVFVGVLTADCVPVLLADGKRCVVAAVHAGWRGALGGVVSNCIAEMLRLGCRCQDILACVGPCIRKSHYEVGPEVRSAFILEDACNDVFFSPAGVGRSDGQNVEGLAEKFLFDLPAYVRRSLLSVGVSRVEDIGCCTYQDERRFYSHRRATHSSQLGQRPSIGRQLSFVGLNSRVNHEADHREL